MSNLVAMLCEHNDLVMFRDIDIHPVPISSGGFGVVYKGVLPNKKEVAIKAISCKTDRDISRIEREVHFHNRAQKLSRYVCRLLGVLESTDQDNKIRLVMELYPTTLHDKLKSESEDLETKLKWVNQVMCTVAILHKHGILHLDLKPANILIDQGNNVKLTDFGLSMSNSNVSHCKLGTRHFQPPEYKTPNGAMISKGADVWACGIILKLAFKEHTKSISDYTRLYKLTVAPMLCPNQNKRCSIKQAAGTLSTLIEKYYHGT